MKRTFALLLALVLCLSLLPAVRADVIYEPQDTFYQDHRGECQRHERSYVAAGPDNGAVVYRSPESSAVVKRLENGQEVWISYTYADKNGISWGFCEDFSAGWSGWVPMDYLLLKYDHISFREEFAHRITEESGPVQADGTVFFWNYPGSREHLTAAVSADHLPGYMSTFTDDAGRNWGSISYYMGIRDVWVCLDAPGADYDTLYADHAPQQVTHPVGKESAALPEITPAGPSLGGILLAVCAVAALSGGFLWITRKKK